MLLLARAKRGNVWQFHWAVGFFYRRTEHHEKRPSCHECGPISGFGDDFSSLYALKGQFYFIKMRFQIIVCQWGFQGEFYLHCYIHYFIISCYVITRFKCIHHRCSFKTTESNFIVPRRFNYSMHAQRTQYSLKSQLVQKFGKILGLIQFSS